MFPLNSPEEWFSRAADKEKVARHFAEDKVAAREAILAAGSAVEFALKAVIMKRERFNSWPERSSRPEIYTHDLYTLFELAGIDHAMMPVRLRARWKVVLSWNRWMDYEYGRVPRRVARDMVEAAFADDGVVPWLKTL